jgi:hypothetical protein
MVIPCCYCSWGIPGVESLPAHYHPASLNDRYEPGSYILTGPLVGQRMPRLVRDPEKEPHFLVNWKAVAKRDD